MYVSSASKVGASCYMKFSLHNVCSNLQTLCLDSVLPVASYLSPWIYIQVCLLILYTERTVEVEWYLKRVFTEDIMFMTTVDFLQISAFVGTKA